MPEFIREIIQRRSLLRELIVRDLKVRYKRPTLGFFWTLLSPLLTVGVFYVVFALLLKIKTSEIPYILYLLTAVFPWAFFQDSILRATTSLVENKKLIKESASPQFLVPLSVVLTNGITFLPILLIIVVTSAVVLRGVPWQLVFLPLVLVLHLFLTVGLSLLFSVIYVKWRDIKFILEPILMMTFYLTPGFYSISLVKSGFSPDLYKFYTYNPMVGFLNLYRICLLKEFPPSLQGDSGLLGLLVIPVFFALFSLWLGLKYYQRQKKHINDYLYY